MATVVPMRMDAMRVVSSGTSLQEGSTGRPAAVGTQMTYGAAGDKRNDPHQLSHMLCDASQCLFMGSEEWTYYWEYKLGARCAAAQVEAVQAG